MATSIAAKTDKQVERDILGAILVDMTAMHASILAITAKLDADAGVTDTNYAATANPAALTTTA